MFAINTPVTGAAMSGFTSPTYTVVADNSAAPNAKAWAVSALGGTQTGVRTHTQSDVFTAQMYKPNVFKRAIQSIQNLFTAQPKNVTGMTIRKGVLTAAGATIYDQADLFIQVRVPAGSETADQANVKAMMSFGFGVLAQQSQNFGDTVIGGLM